MWWGCHIEPVCRSTHTVPGQVSLHYENTPIQIYWQLYHQKMKKKSDIFHISAQNKDCGYLLEPPRRGGSNEYPQPMLLSRNKKNKVCPCKPQFYYIKVGVKGVKIIRHVFVMRRLKAHRYGYILQWLLIVVFSRWNGRNDYPLRKLFGRAWTCTHDPLTCISTNGWC